MKSVDLEVIKKLNEELKNNRTFLVDKIVSFIDSTIDDEFRSFDEYIAALKKDVINSTLYLIEEGDL